MTDQPFTLDTPNGCTLRVRIHPGARKNAITGIHNSALKISLTTPPIEGRANDEHDDEAVLRWLLLAYPDRVVKRRGAERTGVMVGGRGVRLGPESVVRDGELYLALDAHEDRRGGPSQDRSA